MKLIHSFRSYGAYGLVRLAFDLAYTKLAHPQARIIRRPAYIRGVGSIRIGRGFTSGPGLRIDCFEAQASVTIGMDVQLNNNVHLGARDSIVIGNRVLIASNVFISDHAHGVYSGDGAHSSPLEPPAQRVEPRAPVEIGDDVWLGEHVCVLAGVHIGRGTVVGAGSIVTESLPPYSIAVGTPARVIKRFDFASERWVAAS